MKKLVLLLTTLLMAQTAIAGSNTVRTMGTVTNANPNYMRVQYTEQVRQCWQEQVPVAGNSRPQAGLAGNIIQGGVGSLEGAVGAIIGGVIGSKLGEGHGKTTRNGAAIVGALIGAQVGHQGSPGATVTYQTVTRCGYESVPRVKEVIDAWFVTIKVDNGPSFKQTVYTNGQTYNINVGDRIPVTVTYTINL